MRGISMWYVSGTRGLGIVSSGVDVIGMSVVRRMKGFGVVV